MHWSTTDLYLTLPHTNILPCCTDISLHQTLSSLSIHPGHCLPLTLISLTSYIFIPQQSFLIYSLHFLKPLQHYVIYLITQLPHNISSSLYFLISHFIYTNYSTHTPQKTQLSPLHSTFTFITLIFHASILTMHSAPLLPQATIS